jgi:DNA primase
MPKYLNSPETAIYRKNEVLFGLSLAKQAIREKGVVFIVEGYFDHLALYRAGIRNVVATCGTALTVNHLKSVRRFAERAYLLFDADSAGKKATVRAMEIFLEEGFPAKVVRMPEGEDPDTFLGKCGVETFEAQVSAALPAFEFFFRDLCKQRDIATVQGKVSVIDELAPSLRKIADSVERDLYVREIARILSIEEGLIRRKLGTARSPEKELRPRQEHRRRGFGPEELLLSLMGKYPQVALQVREFGPERIFGPDFLPVAQGIISHIVKSDTVDWSQILDTVSSSEERHRLASLFVMEEHIEELDVQKAFEQCRRALDKIALQEIKQLTLRLAQVEPESEQYRDLLRRLDELRARKSRLT